MPQHSRKAASAAQVARIVVLPCDGGWAVRGLGRGKPARFDSKDEALAVAQAALRTAGGVLRVEDRAGRGRESVTIGRDAMAWISAVEGLHLDAQAIAQLRALDGEEASPQRRRDALYALFGRKAG